MVRKVVSRGRDRIPGSEGAVFVEDQSFDEKSGKIIMGQGAGIDGDKNDDIRRTSVRRFDVLQFPMELYTL